MSTTWSIEHIPASGGASTFASLAVWGLAGLRMQFVNWGVDQAAITTRGGSIAFDAAQFAYLDKLVVWRNGARFAHFWITGLGLSADQFESRTYTLSGPSWWLGQYAPFYNASIPYTESTSYWAGTYIQIGMADAVAAGAPVGYSQAIEAALNIGCPDVRRAGTILALVQEAARHVPFSSGWWDSSGETPILHASRRSALSTVTLALGTAAVETFGLTPIPEMQLKSVRIRFGWTGGASYYYNTAGTSSDLSGPNHLQCALNYGTQAAALEAAGCGVAEKVFADMSALPWSGAVNLHATEETDIDPIRPGCALNLTGERDEWATMGALVQSVVWSVSPEANDRCTLQLGAPDHLGIQDYFSLSASVGSASGAESPTPPVDPLGPVPGTLSDLNGTSTGGGEPGGSIPVQSRGGTWTLVGFQEYTPTDGSGLSAPPKRYLREAWSGGNNCDPAVFAGARTVNPATGETTDGTTCNGMAVAYDMYGSPACLYFANTYGLRVETLTRTVRTIAFSGGNEYCTNTGAWVRTLGNEDTADSAVQRLLATAVEWSSSATTAISTVPTTGITGIYRRLRYRTEHTVSEATVYPTLTGLAIWARYRLRIVLQKRAVDSAGAPTGDYATAETVYSAPFTTDLNGEGGVDWAEIEPSAGYETAIQSATPELY